MFKIYDEGIRTRKPWFGLCRQTDDIVDKVARSPERSKIDLVQSFDQIRVDPPDVPKTAFRTHRGNYLHLTMQMGDKNATSTEQQLFDTVFDPIRDYVVNYLDDIMPVNTRTPYEHFLVLCKIFDILRAQKLFVNRKKTKLLHSLRRTSQYSWSRHSERSDHPRNRQNRSLQRFTITTVFPGARKDPRFIHLALITYPGISGTCSAFASIATR